MPLLASIVGPAGVENLKKAGYTDKKLPKLVDSTPYKGLRYGEMKDVGFRKGWRTALLWHNTKLSDVLDFTTPQGKRLASAYPHLPSVSVSTQPEPGYEYAAGGSHPDKSAIWINLSKHKDVDTDGMSVLNTLLHETNHQIMRMEPTFPIGTLPDRSKASYVLNANEILADAAANRGQLRALTKTGSADAKDFDRDVGATARERWEASGLTPEETAAELNEDRAKDAPVVRVQLRQDAKGGESGRGRESTAPTQEQLEEAVEFLETVMEIGACQNEWEQSCVKRIHDVIQKAVETTPMVEGEPPEAPVDEGSTEGDIGGGVSDYVLDPDKMMTPIQETTFDPKTGAADLAKQQAQAQADGFQGVSDKENEAFKRRAGAAQDAARAKELQAAWSSAPDNGSGGIQMRDEFGNSARISNAAAGVMAAQNAAAQQDNGYRKIAEGVVDSKSSGSLSHMDTKSLETNKNGSASNSLLPGAPISGLRESWKA